MRVLLAALNRPKGDVAGNLAAHVGLGEARARGCDLAAATTKTVPALSGVAERGPHITQVYAADGEVVGAYRKRHLGEGEEAYTPGGEPAPFDVDVPV